MDYRIFAKDLLKRKNQLDAAKRAIEFELQDLEEEKFACKSAQMREVPIKGGGGNSAEDRIIGLLVRIDDCRFRLKIVVRELRMIELGMSRLDEYQTALIEAFFINFERGTADSLMERFFKERSVLYDDRNKALDAFTRSVYGVIEM